MNLLKDPSLTEYQKDFIRTSLKPYKMPLSAKLWIATDCLLALWIVSRTIFGPYPIIVENIGNFMLMIYLARGILHIVLAVTMTLLFNCCDLKIATATIKTLINSYGISTPLTVMTFILTLIVLLGAVMNAYVTSSIILVLYLMVVQTCNMVMRDLTVRVVKNLKP